MRTWHAGTRSSLSSAVPSSFPSGTGPSSSSRPPALNYVDNSLFLPEAARVLEPGGTLLIYDCSTGSHPRLTGWLEEFRRRAPDDPDYPMDPRQLGFSAAGLRLESYQEPQITLNMSLDSYHKYILTETDADIAQWCAETLPRAFGMGTMDVVFDTYAARVRLDP